MVRLLIIAGLLCIAYRWMTGRWPWQRRESARDKAIRNARSLLGVNAGANRSDIIAAHKRIVALVHPDRGGSSEQVHEANAARDLLLDELPKDIASQ